MFSERYFGESLQRSAMILTAWAARAKRCHQFGHRRDEVLSRYGAGGIELGEDRIRAVLLEHGGRILCRESLLELALCDVARPAGAEQSTEHIQISKKSRNLGKVSFRTILI